MSFAKPNSIPRFVVCTLLLVLVCLVAGRPAKAQATYNFVGVPFNTFSNTSCPPTCQITGSFTLAEPLAPNLSVPISQFAPDAAGVTGSLTPTAFSFTDGVQTFTNFNTSDWGFSADTDAQGNITNYGFQMSAADNGLYAFSGPGGPPYANETTLGAYEAEISGQGIVVGTWCLSFPPESTQTNPDPCYVSPGSLNFPNTIVGQVSGSQAVTITNSGTAEPLVISSIAIDANYTQTDNCPATIAPGGSCVINVVFAPTATGAQSDLLTITDNVPSSPQVVSLSGTGTAAVATTLSLTSTPNPSVSGQSVTFTATVAPAPPSAGTVNFLDGTTTLGTGALDATGIATYNTSSLPVGSENITASYQAPGNPPPPPVTASMQQVVTAAPPDYGLTVSPASATITAGQSATFTFSVTPQNGFNSAVTFTCGTLPSEASCQFAPATVTPSSGTVTSVLTLTTTPPAVSTNRAPDAPSGRGPAGKVASAVLLVAVFWIAPRRSRGQRYWIVVLLVGLVSAATLTGCGSAKRLTSQNTNPGTPKGTATVTVTATAGSGASAITQNATLTVTIQ